MFGKELIVGTGDVVENTPNSLIIGRCDIAESNKGIALEVTCIAFRDVPAAMSLEEFLVGGGKKGEQVNMASITNHSASLRRASGWRTDFLTVVAAIDAVVQCFAELDRDRTSRLHDPCKAPSGIDHPWGDDRASGATITAALTGSTTVSNRFRGLERCIGHHSSEQHPTPVAGNEDVGVLPEPSNPGTMRGGPVDQGVVVGHDARAMTGGLKFCSDRRQRASQIGIVIFGGVASHSACGVGGFTRSFNARCTLASGIGPGADDERCCTAQQRRRFGGTRRIAIRELHRPVEATLPALLQNCPGVEERFDPGDPDSHQTGGESDGAQILDRELGGRAHAPHRRRWTAESADATAMTQFGHQSGIRQHPQGPIFADIDHEGIAGLAGADEGYDAVGTGIGVLHDALVAIDGEGPG